MSLFLIITALWQSLFFNPQAIVVKHRGGGSTIGTPVGSVCANAGTGACLTNTQTTTAGDTILYVASAATACSNFASTVFLAPTDTGGDTFLPVVLTSGSIVLGVTVTSGGTGYVTPTCSFSGTGTGGGTCVANLTGTSVASVSVTNGGSYTGPVTVTITGAPGTGVATAITGYGQPSSTSFCQAEWYAKNVAATANNQITMPTEMTTITFNSGSAAEISNLSTSAPRDAPSSVGARAASGASITTGAFSTTNANEIVICPTRVENLTNTWTYGNIGGVASSVVTGSTGAGSNNFQTMEYKIFTSIQSGITGAVSSTPNGERTMLCVALTQ